MNVTAGVIVIPLHPRMRDGRMVSQPAFLQDCDRQVTLSGQKR